MELLNKKGTLQSESRVATRDQIPVPDVMTHQEGGNNYE